jgi:hypothetical protein
MPEGPTQQADEPRFATRNGKTLLFKFRPYSTKTDRAPVKEILVDHRVYFSRPSQLNDPFDMSPRFRKTTRKELIDAAKRYLDRKFAPPHEREGTLRYLEECDLNDHMQGAEKHSRKRLETGYTVFSLAGNRDHPMLWSHYAAGHTGLCIHFRADEGSLMGGALEVTYDRLRPTLPFDLSELADIGVFTRLLLQKGEFWAYEDEYRWANYPTTDWTGIPIEFHGQHARFRPRELSGITLGARISDVNRKKLLRIAESHDPPLPVWVAVETDTFDFNFDRVV